MGWGLLGLWRVAPDFAKQLIARTIRLAPDAPNYLKRRATKNEIESAINRAFKQFHREGFVNHEIIVSWLKPGEDAREVFFRSGKAYLKLDYSNSQETNLAEAALRFCRHDMRIAALMREHGIRRICTLDAGFRRFPFLSISAVREGDEERLACRALVLTPLSL